MRIVISFLLLLFLGAAFPAKGAAQDELIRQGLTDIYNLDFSSAESKFKGMQSKYPEDIKGYFYESVIYFYTAMGTKDEKDFERFIDISEGVIEKCEDLIDKNAGNTEAIYYKGLSHSYRSLLMLALNRSLLKAASNGNDGYRILSNVIEKNPGYYDAYMGLGLYKIAIGFVPDKFQWLLSIIGFDGDIKEGIRLLETAAEKGSYTRTEAKAYLSVFSIKEREEQDESSVRLIRQIVDEYPESPFFRIMLGAALQQIGKYDESIEAANTALELNKGSLQTQIRKDAMGILGFCYFRKNDLNRAISFLEEHIKLVSPEDRYNISMYNLGQAYELTGRRDIALQKYRQCRDNFINERDGESEKLFYRYAQEKIQEPITPFDSIIVTVMNLRETGDYDEAFESLEKLKAPGFSKYNSADNKVKVYMETAHLYHYQKDYKNALVFYERVTKENPEREKWYIPHAYFEMGKVYSKSGDKGKAGIMFEKIYDLGNYDMRNFLEMRLRNFKEKL
jgi:tetratricopeptide (TPR) repeat protein